MNNIEDVKDSSDTTYVLAKTIWEKYDMVETKKNVVDFIENFKERRARGINDYNYYGLNSNFTDSVTKTHSIRGGFSNKVDSLIDEEKELEKLESVKKTFPYMEQQYYKWCLENNYPECEFAETIGKRSRYGILSIKNSCILKIALAFDLDVLKD